MIFYRKMMLIVLVALSNQENSAGGVSAQKRFLVSAFMVMARMGVWECQAFTAKQPKVAQKELSAYYAGKESKQLIIEPVEWPVKVVYDNNPLSWFFSWAVRYCGKYVTNHQGVIAHARDPQVVHERIAHYTSFYKEVLNMDEFYIPAQGFATFNDWFIRTFKDIARSRPMSNQSRDIVSPADSKLIIIPNLSKDTRVTIKEACFDIGLFLESKTLARAYEGGVMMIFRLSPYDYHRYHYPFDCTVGAEVCIKGLYHSVNPRAFNVGCKPLTANKRSYQLLTPRASRVPWSTHPVVMVQVGATAVASIVNNFMDYSTGVLRDSALIYQKGSEVGYFQFGGSTIVLLFPPRTIDPDPQIVANSLNGYETAVKVRETIATWTVKGE